MKRGRREAPETEVVDQIAAHFSDPFGDFAAVLLYTGLRTEEAAALQWGDIDAKGENIIVRRAVDLHGTPIIKCAKTEAGERKVPILKKLKPFLVKPEEAKSTDYIFNKNGKLLTRGQISSRWLNWCKAAGLAHQVTFENRHRGTVKCTRTEWRPDVTPHQFRHNYATMLFEADVDELTTKDIVGHKDIATTRDLYTTLRKKHRQQGIAKIQAAFDGKAPEAVENT